VGWGDENQLKNAQNPIKILFMEMFLKSNNQIANPLNLQQIIKL
jgi:hypothetical protein